MFDRKHRRSWTGGSAPQGEGSEHLVGRHPGRPPTGGPGRMASHQHHLVHGERGTRQWRGGELVGQRSGGSQRAMVTCGGERPVLGRERRIQGGVSSPLASAASREPLSRTPDPHDPSPARRRKRSEAVEGHRERAGRTPRSRVRVGGPTVAGMGPRRRGTSTSRAGPPTAPIERRARGRARARSHRRSDGCGISTR